MLVSLFHRFSIVSALAVLVSGGALAAKDEAIAPGSNWPMWRGPYQNGVSLEHYKNPKLKTEPIWTYDTKGRGTPVIYDGRVFSWGYRGAGPDLREVLACLDAKTGAKIWEHEFRDFISDVVYDRYSIGAPTVDPETKKIYLATAYNLLLCFDFDGKELWRISQMEDFGRLSFPNARAGCVVIEGDLAIVHGISSNWGGDGPAADRCYAFDKATGELVWWSLPGVSPPVDGSFGTPVIQTVQGKRVMFLGTGDGSVVGVNARNGKPYFRFWSCKNGINPSVLIHKGNIITLHNDENVDNSEKGRMIALKIPDKLTAPAPGAENNILEPSAEVWRNPLAATSSSPVGVGDRAYQMTDSGELHCVNLDSGEVIWSEKLSNGNLHSSPLYVDGLLYCPFMEGKLFVVKPTDKKGEVLQEIQLKGQCLGAPMVSSGRLYVHTTDHFYCFEIEHEGLTVDPVPVTEMPKAGKAVALQIIPAEVALTPGTKHAFRIRGTDANGLPTGPIEKVKWESFIPPTAKVKATLDAKFNEAGELVAAPEAKLSAGAFKATAEGGIFGTIRGRVLSNLPIQETFEAYELNEDQAQEGVKYAYPPLPWIGARFKFDVREHNGNKVLAKTLDRINFQRATVFLGKSDLSNYTVQADVMTDGSARVKSDIGLINQRYLIVLRGNGGKLEVSSNLERLQQTVPFKMTANKWYVLKTRVDVNPDGSGVVRAKAWEKEGQEPAEWTIEVKVGVAHTQGCPGLFSFTPLNQKRTYIDNISITPN